MAARGSSKQEAPRRRPWAWVVAFVAIVAVLVIAGWALGLLRLDSLPFPSGGSPTTTADPASATPTTTPSALPTPRPATDRSALNLQIREALFTCGENLVPLSQLTTDPVTFIYTASDAPPTVGRDQAIFDLCDRFLGGSNWVDLTADQFNTVQNGDYGQWTSNNAVAVHDDAGDVILINVDTDNRVAVLFWGPAETVAY
jgi:hypothetical protein